MSDLPYDPKPVALELRVLPEGGAGEPEFIWATFPVVSIAAILPMRNGPGCTITLAHGSSLLCSNHYEDVSEALVGNAKRFAEDEQVEARAIATIEVEVEDTDDAELTDDEDLVPFDEADTFSFLEENDVGGDDGPCPDDDDDDDDEEEL